MGFPTKNGSFWGVLGVPPFKETPIFSKKLLGGFSKKADFPVAGNATKSMFLFGGAQGFFSPWSEILPGDEVSKLDTENANEKFHNSKLLDEVTVMDTGNGNKE